VKTVEKHRSNIMRKLDIHTASGMTAYAIEKGLVTKQAKTP
jgi:DNA-binding NarL/FixJ family response regulator